MRPNSSLRRGVFPQRRGANRRGSLDTTLLWQQARLGDLEARSALIERYRPFVAQLVARMGVPATVVADRDDLLSAGVVGLIVAIDRYDPDRAVPFEAFAAQRVRGAVIDELRTLDSRGRAAWRQARLLRATADSWLAREGREPTVTELAAATALDGHGVQAALRSYSWATVSLDRLIELGGEPGGDDPAAPVLERDLLEDVGSAVRSLPERERDVLAQYYGASRTLREIGLQLGVSEARVCQLHARAIAHLRGLLFTTPAQGRLSAGAA